MKRIYLSRVGKVGIDKRINDIATVVNSVSSYRCISAVEVKSSNDLVFTKQRLLA